MIWIEKHENGPRLWIFGHRSHHWHAGCVLMVLGARWIWRDRADLLRRN